MHTVLLPIALMLASAKLAGEFFERILKQPAVLAEILVGILLGQSVLRWVDGNDLTLTNMAEVGAVLLLFEIGLECNLDDLLRVGREALWTAVLGVILPFVFGFFAARALGQPVPQSVFVGAALTATSVGITARVFSDINALHIREAKIVLGAAVADDVIGLIVLASVSGIATGEAIGIFSIAKVTLIALTFLIGALVLGIWATPWLLKAARAMRTRAAASSAAVVLCLLTSVVSGLAGLAPIVGAFAAGLVLAKTDDKIHFEEKVRSIADLFVPIFFVIMGARMQLSALTGPVLAVGAVLMVVAVIGKVIAGLTVPAKGLDRWIVAVGMIPRGEVGLIFANIGLEKKILEEGLYGAIILVVIVTTFLTPPLLKIAAAKAVAREALAS